MVSYPDMLRDNIREFMSISGCETLNDMVYRAREREIDLVHLGKTGSDQVHVVEGPRKRPKTSDQRLRGPKGRYLCNDPNPIPTSKVENLESGAPTR